MVSFVTRKQWGATPPKSVSKGPMLRPSTGHWNGPTVTAKGKVVWEHDSCAGLVRGIQSFHMHGRGWSDIAYNFIICPHGFIFEGRGFNTYNAANGVTSANRSSHAIMFLAGEGNVTNELEKRAFKFCVTYIYEITGAENRAVGHRDHKATSCPGDTRYYWIRQGMPVKETPKNPETDEEIEMLIIQHPSGASVAIMPPAPPLGIKSAATLKNFGAKFPVIPVDDATWQEWHAKLK